jgi:hypothetical protein
MTDIICFRRESIVSQLLAVCDDIAFYARGRHVDTNSRLMLEGSGAVVEEGLRPSKALRRVQLLILKLNEEPRVSPVSRSPAKAKRQKVEKELAKKVRRHEAVRRIGGGVRTHEKQGGGNNAR